LPIEQRAVAAMGEKTFEPFNEFALHDHEVSVLRTSRLENSEAHGRK
jgi:hypothetical protein